MLSRHIFYSFICVLLVSNLIFAQAAPTDSAAEKEKAQKEREKKAVDLMEDIAAEVSLLKFSDNRALILASVADLLWKRDEKRARQLFRHAADELVATNNAPPENTNSQMMLGFGRIPSPRQEILMTAASRDPEFALELLYMTRPAFVAAALAAYAQTQPAKPGTQTPAATMEQTQNRFLAENELRLEQSFSVQAADNDPKLAAKMLRENMAKNGVTISAFNVVQKINQNDNELAVKLLDEIGQKLGGETLDGNFDKINLTVSFLTFFYTNLPKVSAKPDAPKPLKLEERAAKDLANKIADSLVKAEASRSINNYSQFRRAMPVLEKVIPERIPILKQKQEAMKKALPQEMAFSDDFFGSDNNTPEKMIANVSRMPEHLRGSMYRSAINQALSGSGDFESVRAALNQAPSGKQRDDALAYLDSRIAERKIAEGKVDEARKIIDSLSSTREKVERLVQMAIGFQRKGTKEDKETAAKLMTEARSLIDYSPQDEDAIGDFLRIASGYAYIEPDTSFSMLDAFADQTNELVNAAAVVAKFDKNNPNFKNGELIFTRGLPRIGTSVLRYGREAQLLANADIDRLKSIAEKFQRPDARILLKLYIAQAFFTGRIGLQGGRGFIPENVSFITMSN